MKNYVIYDEDLDREIGYLFYYEKAEKFIIELCDDLDEWSAPLLFQGLVQKKIYTISHTISQMWVEERIIPSGRQNIGSILKHHRLLKYCEMALLNLSNGKCSQDHCYIEEMDYSNIPIEIRDRSKGNVSECFPTSDGRIICIFRDHTVKKINLECLEKRCKDIAYVRRNQELLDSVCVGVGGYSIIFNNSIEVDVRILRELGETSQLTGNDFYDFVQKNVVDATKACNMMQCSRQNLSYLVKEGKITPIMEGTKSNLYTKGAVWSAMSE